MTSYLDWSQLERRLTRCMDEFTYSNHSSALAHIVLERLFGLEASEIGECLTDGGNDRGIDAIYFDISTLHDEPTVNVHIFQFKCVGAFDNSKRNFPGGEVDKIISFLDDFLSRSEQLSKNCNPFLLQRINDLYNIADKYTVEITIHLCSNTEPLQPSDRKRFSEYLEGIRANLSEHSLSDLAEYFLERRKSNLERTINIVQLQAFEKTDGDVRGLVGTIKAEELVKLISNPFNKKEIYPPIFFDNIRVFLGFSNPVNEKIFQSAISKENHQFWYLNNGITITCESFSRTPGLRDGPTTLVNPQIVNGSQTSHSIFEAFNEDRKSVQNLCVLVRIYETKDEKLSIKIAEATNSQTRIFSRDLMSNNIIQEKLEAALRDFGYFYERKKNQHSGRPPHLRIDAFKLGQILLSYNLDEPDKSKSSSDDIFDSYYSKIFRRMGRIETQWWPCKCWLTVCE